MTDHPLNEPLCLLPDRLTAVVGVELSVYWESVFYSALPGALLNHYLVDVTSHLPNDANAMQQNERWTITPTAANVGTGTVTFDLYSDALTLVLSHTCTVTVCEDAAWQTPRRLLVIGDSTTDNVNKWLGELQRLAGVRLEMVGTWQDTYLDSLGTVHTLRHQAMTGRTVAWFWGDYGLLTGSSPFVRDGQFDFAWYLSANPDTVTLQAGDWICFHLGINDVFPFTTDAEVEAKIAQAFARLEAMIGQMQTCVPGVRIGMCQTIPPAATQDGFGKNLDSRQNRWRYARNRALWVRALNAQFGGREAQGIYIVPFGVGLDTAANFPYENVKAHFYADILAKIKRQKDHVHPDRIGYWQMAATAFPFFVGQALSEE